MHWRRKWQPTPVFLPGESQGWGAWWAAVHGVAQSRTRLKRLRAAAATVVAASSQVLDCCYMEIGMWVLKSESWLIHRYICLLAWLTLLNITIFKMFHT